MTFNAAGGFTSTSDPTTFNAAINAGSNVVLWVGFHSEDMGAIVGVTIDGGAATLVLAEAGYFPVTLSVYRRALGTKGSGNVAVSIDLAGPSGGDCEGGWICESDIDQATPENATASISFVDGGVEANRLLVSVTASDASALMGGICISTTDINAAASNTEQAEAGPSSYGKFSNVVTRASAGSGSLSVGFTNDVAAAAGIIAWESNPAAGGGGGFVPDEDYLIFVPSRLP